MPSVEEPLSNTESVSVEVYLILEKRIENFQQYLYQQCAQMFAGKPRIDTEDVVVLLKHVATSYPANNILQEQTAISPFSNDAFIFLTRRIHQLRVFVWTQCLSSAAQHSRKVTDEDVQQAWQRNMGNPYTRAAILAPNVDRKR